MSSLSVPIEELGIVGCGGAGFPTHVKLAARNIDYLIANGAECEPLLHKDKELMLHQTEPLMQGLKLALDMTGAKQAFIGVKKKYSEVVSHLQQSIDDTRIKILQLGDFYPAGDEYELVYEATKRLIPYGGIPLNIGCVVTNVETLSKLGRGKPMITKLLTITGKVPRPITVEVPIGLPVREAFALAGLHDLSGLAVIDGGPMMGRLLGDVNREVVTKTCGGLIALPAEHPLIRKMSRPLKDNTRIARSSCDQCTDCTELCPRFLLGYPIKPHKAMRTAQLSVANDQSWSIESIFCCECGLCSLFSCPEDLPPREIAVAAKKYHLGRGVKPTDWKGEPKVHPMRAMRRVSVERLIKKLGLFEYDRPAPFVAVDLRVERVRLPLKMHVGVPVVPIVKVGDRVVAGQKIGAIPEKKLGAVLHASISGKVIEVTSEAITIARE